jgi:hypothetical protein
MIGRPVGYDTANDPAIRVGAGCWTSRSGSGVGIASVGSSGRLQSLPEKMGFLGRIFENYAAMCLSVGEALTMGGLHAVTGSGSADRIAADQHTDLL